MTDLVVRDKYSGLNVNLPKPAEATKGTHLAAQDADRIIQMLRELYRDMLCGCENCERHKGMIVATIETAERIKSYGK